ncbi:probable ATP-dependent RNA helicase spindle-E [Thrips palmi]|uniref:Probable ATP-dependent RNA helicase spindle-E n=1 Tax=Thrips palmi TaxID=161013 RepID=A0A6P8ZLR3_THRPL|nr:probable ATP-dependent RNA helicase spindle-E [Thrips palmi]
METNEVMSVADFCNFNKKVEMITIRGGAVMGREIEQPDILRKNEPKKRPPVGTDYAKPYIDEEERLLLQGFKFDTTDPPNLPGSSRGNQMEDTTTIGSVANLCDVEDDDDTKVYDLYDFTPKESKLPIEIMRDKIVRMVDTNQVLIILGSTGCGKTTQVPQYILDDHAQQRKRCNIVVTQPRRIAAVSVASRVCSERGWELSTIVGYQIGLDNKTSPDTRLTYCTTGVMREKLVRDRHMMGYTHVIIDEVHERDLETDFLMLIVRQLLRTNSSKVKVILMSATIDPTHFARYFSLPIGDRLYPAPILEVEKFSRYTVSHYYINQLQKLGSGTVPEFEPYDPQLQDEVMAIAVRLIMMLDTLDPESWKARNEKPSVLVFLPGIHEIETMHDRLHQEAIKNDKFLWHLIPLHSSITKAEQQKVFREPKAGHRKVILSTNIAESSITVSDVVYVIDFCLTKHLICDEITNFTSLKYAWASHANCKQRAGRTGRLCNGRVYRMVPQSFYEDVLPIETVPEMIRCPLTTTVLKAKLLKMGEPKAILAKALDPPDLTRLETTILLLKEAGALLMTSDGKFSKFDGDMTYLGSVMAHLPLDIHLSKLILLGNVFSILEDTIVIAAWMAVRNVFKNDFYDRLGPYESKINFSAGSASDCIAYLNVYHSYKEKLRTNYFKTGNDTENTWCRRNFLDFKALKEADELVDELRKRLKNLGVYESTSEARPQWDRPLLPILRKVVIAGAFYPNYFVRSAQGGQVVEKDAVKAVNGKDPCSTVYLSGLPSHQPPQLYSKAFADILGKYAGVVSNVSYDGSSKVYIDFERKISEYLPGKISYPVYRAVKMRQLRIPIEIPVLSPEEAEKRMKKYGETADRYLCIGKLKAPPKDRLPSLSVEYIKFVPSYVDNPNKFWIHCGIEAELESVQIKLNTPGNVFTLTEKPVVGGIFAAPFPLDSGILYRAQISSVDMESKIADVKFIDYGNVEKMPIKLLCEFGPSIQDLRMTHLVPPFALECSLMGIGPSFLSNENGIWSEESIGKFMKLINCGELIGEIYSVVDGVLSLTVTQSEKKGSLNKILIKQGLAVEVEESLRSKCNNLQRVTARNYDNGVSNGSQNPSQSTFLVDNVQHSVGRVAEFVDPPTRRECRNNTVRMRGPSSPLEMKVYGCTNVSSGKDISMDVDSINSVLLDSNPEDPHERLLIAGYVRANSSGSKLKLGHSTLLPNIHGLSSLMCLIFSPQVELRLSRDKRRYIGALCGLGYDNTTAQSIFPENEMEMKFDCVIDIEDMRKINHLRYWMSKTLKCAEGDDDTCEASPADIVRAQQQVHNTLFKLLSRHRPSIEVEDFRFTYEWNKYDDDDFLLPDFPDDERAVYKPHFALKIKDCKV